MEALDILFAWYLDVPPAAFHCQSQGPPQVSPYRHYIPPDTLVECLFGGVSTQFPHHRIKGLDITELQRYVVRLVEGASPSRAKFYTTDDILLRTKYKLIRG
ncbi:hypothetical protein BFJ69_g5895 [Fusarium oxysporum]|uniref:Uncharacterized protein n=1 Tax=Fusarium oxysporum TaxID=5507 RepID=A0A420NCA6_FUSOX|nr:hypothetical protein BFJ69_g5895 [Fusarium oxysporum]